MKTNQFTLLFLLLFVPCFVGAQITKPGYKAPKKSTNAPASPKKFSGSCGLMVKIDSDGTLLVDYEKVFKYKKGQVWRSDIKCGEHVVTLTNGIDTWEQTITLSSGQKIINTNLKQIKDTRVIRKEQSKINEALRVGTEGIFTDSRDGKTYKTVKLGNGQIWMAENLNYNVSGSMCYDNNSSNCATYGRLYTWQQAKQACPPGWRLPTKADFEKLENLFDHEKQAYSYLIKGGNSGFYALLGGYSYGYNGSFNNQGRDGYFWSSTVSSAGAWQLKFNSDGSRISVLSDFERNGYSCRCLKDE